jgi:glycosyltransferase involved in cell wall biosynthesis
MPDILQKIKRLPMLGCHWIHENLFFHMADKIFCISEWDFQYYKQKISEQKLGLLPYFFDDSHLAKKEMVEEKKPFVILIGSLQSYQNYDAAVYALTRIWPEVQTIAKDLSMYIVGKLPAPGTAENAEIQKLTSKQQNVCLTGEVPSVVPYVKSALVNMVPIRIGSGVRTKIIESAACRTPVVSTAVGAEGLPFQDGSSIYLADRAEAFAGRVMELVNDPRKRTDMAETAYQIYRKTLSLEAGIRTLKAICDGEHVS